MAGLNFKMRNWNLEGKYCEGKESVVKYYGTDDIGVSNFIF